MYFPVFTSAIDGMPDFTLALFCFVSLMAWKAPIVPEFDRIAAASEELPQRANDILPLDLRPALLAGVAMIIRGGPEMLRSLRREMMGQNRSRFDYFVEQLVPAFNCSDRPTQLHLI